MEVKPGLRGELLLERLAIALRVNRRHELELIAESRLESEHASFKNPSGFRELTLQPQVVRDVNQ